MAGEIQLTICGSLTSDPEIRYTPSGAPVANFTVASNSRHFDRQSGEWKDDPATFLRCNLWREPAENAANSLTRGTRVIVTGRLRQRSFETKEGEKRSVMELEVDEIGPSLRWATATINKVTRSSGGGGDWSQRANGPAVGSNGPAYDDPWGSAPAVGASAAAGGEPPF